MQRFDIRAARVVHRVGALAPRDQIVLVVVSFGAPRRGLRGLPVPDGLPEDAGAVLEEGAPARRQREWVDARVADDAALERWGLKSGNAA